MSREILGHEKRMFGSASHIDLAGCFTWRLMASFNLKMKTAEIFPHFEMIKYIIYLEHYFPPPCAIVHRWEWWLIQLFKTTRTWSKYTLKIINITIHCRKFFVLSRYSCKHKYGQTSASNVYLGTRTCRRNWINGMVCQFVCLLYLPRTNTSWSSDFIV